MKFKFLEKGRLTPFYFALLEYFFIKKRYALLSLTFIYFTLFFSINSNAQTYVTTGASTNWQDANAFTFH